MHSQTATDLTGVWPLIARFFVHSNVPFVHVKFCIKCVCQMRDRIGGAATRLCDRIRAQWHAVRPKTSSKRACDE
jgi:hypothetical protein